MNNLKAFTNNDLSTVRTVTINNEPFFVGRGQVYFINKLLGAKEAM